MFTEGTSGGSEVDDGKNLHVHKFNVNAMRFLAPPARSNTRPSRLCERMLQASTLVVSCNETECAAEKQD